MRSTKTPRASTRSLRVAKILSDDLPQYIPHGRVLVDAKRHPDGLCCIYRTQVNRHRTDERELLDIFVIFEDGAHHILACADITEKGIKQRFVLGPRSDHGPKIFAATTPSKEELLDKTQSAGDDKPPRS